MIGEGPSLIDILPSSLQQALDRSLQAQQPVVALRGNPHEAFAAPPTRLMFLRDGAGIMAEPVSFAVPSYDAAKYRMAANALRRILPAGSGSGGRGEAAGITRCPKCST